MTLASWNGELGELEEMRVPVTDRAFFFADAAYEVVRIYNGRLWLMEEHLKRFSHSLSSLGIEPDDSKVDRWTKDLMAASNVSDDILYLQISRGSGPRQHSPSEKLVPNFLGFVKALPQDPYLSQRGKGASISLSPDQRWGRCDIKSTCLLPNILAQMEAKSEGFDESVFYDQQQRITEGSHSSVLIVKKQEVVAPPHGPHLLPGITRDYVAKTCVKLGIPYKEGWFTVQELYEADEGFLAGTTTEVLSVTHAENKTVGSGKPGPVTLTLQSVYQKQSQS